MTQLTPTAQNKVDRLVDLNATIAELQDAANDLKSQLRAELPPGEYTDAGGAKRLTVSAPARRFQPDLAERILPTEFLSMCVVPKVDPATARRVLPPALYTACCTATGDSVLRLA